MTTEKWNEISKKDTQQIKETIKQEVIKEMKEEIERVNKRTYFFVREFLNSDFDKKSLLETLMPDENILEKIKREVIFLLGENWNTLKNIAMKEEGYVEEMNNFINGKK